MFDKYFPENFTLETPRVLLEPISHQPITGAHGRVHPSTDGTGGSQITFNITDLHTKTLCGIAEYHFRGLPAAAEVEARPASGGLDDRSPGGGGGVVPGNVDISWRWNDPEDADQGLIKNLKFVMLSYGFQVMKLDKITMVGDGTMTIKKEEWQHVKETFFPELM